jgi:hypothetical protein
VLQLFPCAAIAAPQQWQPDRQTADCALLSTPLASAYARPNNNQTA